MDYTLSANSQRVDQPMPDIEPEGLKSESEELNTNKSERNGRGSGLGRKRKKKVFADYYYGDEIFTKPKNGAKKRENKQKLKLIKGRGKYRIAKKVGVEELRKKTTKSKVISNCFVYFVIANHSLLIFKYMKFYCQLNIYLRNYLGKFKKGFKTSMVN